MILYPPSYFLRPSRGSILLVLTDRALADLFPASNKILPTDQHAQQRSGTTRSQQYTAGKNIVKQNSTKHAKGTMHYRQEDFFFKKKKQTGGMSTRTVNQDNFAVLACCFTSWRKAKKVCEVYLWYTSGVTHLLQWGVAEWFGPELVRVTCMCLPQSSRAGTLTAPTSSVPC